MPPIRRGSAFSSLELKAFADLKRVGEFPKGFQRTRQIEIRNGDATCLPVPDDSLDVIISNGVLNLVPEKELGFAEIMRVLKPGGRLHLADIALDIALPEDVTAT